LGGLWETSLLTEWYMETRVVKSWVVFFRVLKTGVVILMITNVVLIRMPRAVTVTGGICLSHSFESHYVPGATKQAMHDRHINDGFSVLSASASTRYHRFFAQCRLQLHSSLPTNCRSHNSRTGLHVYLSTRAVTLS